MVFLLILLYALSLIHLAKTVRVRPMIYNLGFQGLLLFGIAYYHLAHVDTPHLLLILLETIIVKTILIPVFLNIVRRRNNIHKLGESSTPIIVSVFAVSLILIMSFVLSSYLHEEHLETKFFSIAIASILAGLYFVIAHRSIFIQLIGYIIIENGIFLLSLSVGSEMPLIVNMAILLDIFISVLILGVFVNKISSLFRSTDIDELTQLKD